MSSKQQAAVAMLVLSPDPNQMNERIQQKLKSRLLWVFARFQKNDKLCELNIMDDTKFRRWLMLTALPALSKKDRQVSRKTQATPKSDDIEKLQKSIPNEYGVGNLISNWGEME
jgi:hypothetical protein